MNPLALSVEDIANYGAATAEEYAMVMLRRARRAGYYTTRAPVVADDGFVAYWSADYELTVRDGNEWVSIQYGDVGKWRLVRGSPPPGFDESVNLRKNKCRPAPNIVSDHGDSLKRLAIKDIVPASKRPTVDDGVRTGFGDVQTLDERVPQTGSAETMEKGAQTTVRLEELKKVRSIESAAQRYAHSTGSGTHSPTAPALQALALSSIFTTTQTPPYIPTSSVVDLKELLNESNILAKEFQEGLTRIRKLESENDQLRGLKERLIRASSIDNPIVTKKGVEIRKISRLIDEGTEQLQERVIEKQRLDDQIADHLEL